MSKHTTVIAALAIATLGWSQSVPVPVPTLKEEAITIEYCASTGEAALMIEAEAEVPINHVVVRKADGETVLRLQTRTGLGMQLAGFEVQSAEGRLSEILAQHEPGAYRMYARTVHGEIALGQAVLSHHLPDAPLVTYPLDGAVNVPAGNFEVTWESDPEVVGYRVGLEQGETDGIAASLPAGSRSFLVPIGVLGSREETHLEVIAVGANGNMTGIELTFTTL